MGKSSKEKRRRRDRDSKHRHKTKHRSRHDSDDSSESNASDSDSRSQSRSRSPVRHKKQSKHRSRSRSSSRSRRRSSHGESGESRKVLTAEEKQRQKEVLKALETPEEKRARRLAKKEAKERKRKEEMGWDKDYLGYTNVDNPFGDEHLLDTFVWTKKLEKEGKKDMSAEQIQTMHRSKMVQNKAELEKVKKRRLEREKEWEEREKEREMLQREKEADYFKEWEKQEDGFHLNQAKLRSEIRIKDGRAKPIDLLAKYISAEDDELAVEMHEPYTYLYGLTIQDLEDLLEDIKVYLELEEGKNADYWRDIITVTQDELAKLRKLDANSRDFIAERRDGINNAVNSEIGDIFKGKTTNQLKLLEKQIKDKLSGGEGIDVGYWESLLQQLKAHKARTRLRERHQDVLRQKLFKLKREQGIESGPLFPVVQEEGTEGSPSVRSQPSSPQVKAEVGSPRPPHSPKPQTSTAPDSEEDVAEKETEDKDNKEGEEEVEEEEEEAEAMTEEDLQELEYVKGGYSPRLMRAEDLTLDAVIYDEADDSKKLELARKQVYATGRVRTDGETEFEKKAREGMDMDEAQFSVEVNLEQQAFMWSDKYRPRKPRFFNRVHTGFEWNKYNQTHYDIDNPPPKIVQGYKFNIFYPDLIDKANTPEYFVTPMDGSKDFALLRFHAGPPYEDIAFKIVNREWEYSYKRGFRCQFHNNIFQLWFHFKRYRYRR
ncbi:cactin [Aplysia californica]|uniref:Splicing factor Cactin n=1 Tax=Aplysia californica TaxID=6500 RepID=A0ABM0JP86_APLCA|nr:cactin [Aplysia californica]